uniref:Solute carrier organic anion transporter family member n=1 Tax=Ciona savignyi TaxID=51511 RepID=H2Z038_CIOSA
MIGGLTNTNISTLERRFGLSSSQSALVVVSYDVAFCILTAFVTYFGATANRPRLVGIGSAIFGIGAFVYALPHFLSPLYKFGDSTLTSKWNELFIGLALGTVHKPFIFPSNATNCLPTDQGLMKFMFVLLFGQLLLGCGTVPLYTLGVAYIEDSVPKNSAPIYLGIANAASLFGPAIGFACGGYILNNFLQKMPYISLLTSSSDPRWVGAWWIGPMAMMTASWILVIPLCGFPKQLPDKKYMYCYIILNLTRKDNGTGQIRAERKSEVHTNSKEEAENSELENSLKNFPTAVMRLFKNPAFCFLTLAGCSTGLTVSGGSSFMAKFIQNEFHTSAGTSAMLAGAILVPAAVAGHLLGGGLISRFQMETPAILKLCAFSSFLVACASPLLLLRCGNKAMAGITATYNRSNLTSGCNSNCNCQTEFYNPVCGGNGVAYFSPCYAGCPESSGYINSTIQVYNNCSCLGVNETAHAGVCEASCFKLPLFLGLALFMVLLTFISHTPAVVVSLRIVPPSMRSFAIGLEWLFLRALGTIPGPILYGSFIDSTCKLWQSKECGTVRGSCWVYDS